MCSSDCYRKESIEVEKLQQNIARVLQGMQERQEFSNPGFVLSEEIRRWGQYIKSAVLFSFTFQLRAWDVHILMSLWGCYWFPPFTEGSREEDCCKWAHTKPGNCNTGKRAAASKPSSSTSLAASLVLPILKDWGSQTANLASCTAR